MWVTDDRIETRLGTKIQDFYTIMMTMLLSHEQQWVDRLFFVSALLHENSLQG
jgi:hypothetical protein